METEDQLSSDEDDGTNNSLGMQLLEYMKNPGTGWKSQDEQLIVAFQEAHSTPFELPEGADIPELVKRPEEGSTIIPWVLREDIATERASTEQKHTNQRDKKVARALRTIESGEDHLDLSHLHLDDEAAVKCAEKLKTSFGMKKFSISLNHISFQGAQALGAVLAPLPRLTSLSFSYNSLGSEGAASLARCLGKSSVLTELNLDHNGIGPMLPSELMQLTSLQTLTLRNNKLETFPLEMLRVIPLVDLEGNPAYLEMFLNCELEDEEEEANKRSARRQALHSLSLAWSAWEDLDMPRARELMVKAKKDALRAGGGEQECASLVDKLKEAESAIAKRTEALGPSFVRVNDPAQVMVGNAIERASLKVREGGADISLLNQRVGDVGMISMAEALMGNATVTWLDISGCNVGPKGVSALAPWIGKSPVLQTLWAASNPLLGDRGCTELAAGLKTNTILAKLDLSNCSVGAQGCTAVVKALQSNPSLRELRLALNNYGDEGATAVAHVLKDMRNLQELDLAGSNVRETGNAQLSLELKFHMGLIGGNFWR
eukprot:Tamp_04997.p1 GENE.Tamp_04997~~Tamp_04997.p1  ORF type:complete len:546 (-),score=117.47 Tamp_04997:1014-2651(-)